MRVHRSGIAAGFAGVALAASLVLTGCSIFPSPPSAGGGSGGAGGSGGTTSTDPGTDTSLDQYKGLPSTFPKGDIPLISGDIPVGIDLGTGWTVIVKVNDTAAAFTEATGKLKAAGFTAQAEQTSDAGSFGDYITNKYEVQVTAQDTSDYGPSVTYLVVLKG
jgi:hypothetical protein